MFIATVLRCFVYLQLGLMEMLLVLKVSQSKHIHPEGNMYICTKFNSISSNSFWNISLKTTNVKLMVALQEMSGDDQS